MALGGNARAQQILIQHGCNDHSSCYVSAAMQMYRKKLDREVNEVLHNHHRRNTVQQQLPSNSQLCHYTQGQKIDKVNLNSQDKKEDDFTTKSSSSPLQMLDKCDGK